LLAKGGKEYRLRAHAGRAVHPTVMVLIVTNIARLSALRPSSVVVGRPAIG
jgi:hypothetical protein